MGRELKFFDEMYGISGSRCRAPYRAYNKWIKNENLDQLSRQSKEAEQYFRRTGITFSVHDDKTDTERLIPFDVIPRIISSKEWEFLERGVKQRALAINMFLNDIYNRQEVIKSGRVPKTLIKNNAAFVPQMVGFTPPGNVYTHILGLDIVRESSDVFFVLEDNVRTPSGVSYMLENRETMLRMFPELFSQIPVREIKNYPRKLRQCLAASAPSIGEKHVSVGVLTPGVFNSAYYEHCSLAEQMGAELIESQDVRIIDGRVAMRTTEGYKCVDVLYRRLDDQFLDPMNFDPRSLIGIPGLMDVYLSGGITIANAPGTGIADDKAIYSFMPEIIEFYTGETPILKNVPTWRCSEPESLAYVLENMTNLVIKEVHGSGGYGLLVGPTANKRELASFRKKLKMQPGNYIAQPTLSLSTVPVLTRKGLAPRHVDLRPFVLMSPRKIEVTPGGLTRVALRDKSLVVNSSQGGGTKDTWVLE